MVVIPWKYRIIRRQLGLDRDVDRGTEVVGSDGKVSVSSLYLKSFQMHLHEST